MKTTVPEENLRAVVSGTQIIGISAGTNPDGANATLGYNATHRLSTIDENTSVGFEWPTSDFFSSRVGSLAPFLDEQSKQDLLNQPPGDEE